MSTRRFLGIVALIAGAYWLSCHDDDAELLAVPGDKEFDPESLRQGTAVEMEHTADRATAKKIAKHHLMEDPNYYEKLATIHLD